MAIIVNEGAHLHFLSNLCHQRYYRRENCLVCDAAPSKELFCVLDCKKLRKKELNLADLPLFCLCMKLHLMYTWMTSHLEGGLGEENSIESG